MDTKFAIVSNGRYFKALEEALGSLNFEHPELITYDQLDHWIQTLVTKEKEQIVNHFVIFISDIASIWPDTLLTALRSKTNIQLMRMYLPSSRHNEDVPFPGADCFLNIPGYPVDTPGTHQYSDMISCMHPWTIIMSFIKTLNSLLNGHNLVSIDFFDLQTFLQNSGECFFSEAVTEDQNTIPDAFEKAIKHLDNRTTSPVSLTKFIIAIEAPKSFNIQSVQPIYDLIDRHIDQEAALLFGICCHNDKDEHVSIRILANHSPLPPEPKNQLPDEEYSFLDCMILGRLPM